MRLAKRYCRKRAPLLIARVRDLFYLLFTGNGGHRTTHAKRVYQTHLLGVFRKRSFKKCDNAYSGPVYLL